MRICHVRHTLALMCAKNHLPIFGSFLDIWENVEWPRFLDHPVGLLKLEYSIDYHFARCNCLSHLARQRCLILHDTDPILLPCTLHGVYTMVVKCMVLVSLSALLS